MSQQQNDKEPTGMLVVAISSGALFDLNEGHQIYEDQGVDAYIQYQIENELVPLKPGAAFHLVEKLLHVNEKHDKCLIEVILLSRNSADTGLRVFNSIENYGLNIRRAAFTNGSTPYPYLQALGAHLFLSRHAKDVRDAIEQGCAAATMLSRVEAQDKVGELVKIAFDGDAVLFSDELERLHRSEGLDAVRKNEKMKADKPLDSGPFQGFLQALSRVQNEFSGKVCPIRTALVTARSAPAHERVIKTLRAWDIKLDEAFFLGGKTKGEVLSAFDADIFFDDQAANCESSRHYVATGHVPYGIVNNSQ
ncbi:MAG: 5'-nucleotidase [Pseudomonadota bacterium]|nr:5'-nucleotidase [Pseudomonadota bacterium]